MNTKLYYKGIYLDLKTWPIPQGVLCEIKLPAWMESHKKQIEQELRKTKDVVSLNFVVLEYLI